MLDIYSKNIIVGNGTKFKYLYFIKMSSILK